MKSVLIARHGAFGDCIHVSHLPRLFKDQGYDVVGVSTGKKGANIFYANPFIDRFHIRELMEHTNRFGLEFFDSRLEEIGRDYDRVVNLNQVVEVKALPGQFQIDYYLDQKHRERMGSDNYYDLATKAAGFHNLLGKYKGEIFFTENEEGIVRKELSKYDNNFKVMINISGTSPHKLFIQSSEVIPLILQKYPEAVVYTTGDKKFEEFDKCKGMDRVVSIVGKRPFRQALCMAKNMNCVIGCESGLMCGSSTFGVPTIHLMTAAAINNHCKYAENDLSIQSPCRCSPCFKNPYDYYGCPKKNYLPACIYFDIDKIMGQIHKAYELWTSKINIAV